MSATADAARGGSPRRARATPAAAWWPLAALTLLAAALRLSTLDLQSFWYDEAFTPVHVLHPSLWATLRSVVHTREHAAAVVRDRVGRLARARHRRGRAAPALGARRDRHRARRLGDRPRAEPAAAPRLVCAALVAVNPLFVWYSQEARAYALFVLTAALAMLCFLRARREPTPRRMAAFALTGALALLTHYFAVFLLIPMVLWLAVRPAHAAARRCPRVGVLALVGRGAAAADLRPGRARHAVDRPLAAVGTAAGDPAVLPHRLLRRAARTRHRAAGRAADPRRPRRSACGACTKRRSAIRPAARASGKPRGEPADRAGDRRLRGADPDRAGRLRRRLPGAAQPRRGDDPRHRRDRCGRHVRRRSRSAGRRWPRWRSSRRSRWRSWRSRLDVDLSPRLQRGNWRDLAKALRGEPAERVITTVELGSAPLEYYLPGCTSLHEGSSVRVREIDETGYAPLRASRR